MSEYLNQLLKSGKVFVTDTKKTKVPPSRMGNKDKKSSIQELSGVVETDPHKNFQKWCISEKPKPKEIIKQFQKFIEGAEADL